MNPSQSRSRLKLSKENAEEETKGITKDIFLAAITGETPIPCPLEYTNVKMRPISQTKHNSCLPSKKAPTAHEGSGKVVSKRRRSSLSAVKGNFSMTPRLGTEYENRVSLSDKRQRVETSGSFTRRTEDFASSPRGNSSFSDTRHLHRSDLKNDFTSNPPITSPIVDNAARSRLSREVSLTKTPVKALQATRLAAFSIPQPGELYKSQVLDITQKPARNLARYRTPTEQTPGNSSGSDTEDSAASRSSRSGVRTPTTPGRSPYVQRIRRPENEGTVPDEHDRRLKFPERAARSLWERSVDEIKVNGGLISKGEKEKLSVYCALYQKSNKLSDHQLAELVQSGFRGSADSKEFFRNAHEVLPYRKRKSLICVLQRMFHNFGSRGQWSREDDERLAIAVAKHGRRWKPISLEIGKHWEDCRDRYRNYHLVKNQKLSKWEDDESEALQRAVGDVILLVAQEEAEARKRHSSLESRNGVPPWTITERDASKMFLWDHVAERIPQRSRLQCYTRFGLLRGLSATSYTLELNRAMKRAGINDQVVGGFHIITEGKSSDVPEGIPTKVAGKPDSRHRRKIKELYNGDRIELLEVIQASHVCYDDDIDWDDIRRSRPDTLAVFGDGLLQPEWESMKAKYKAAKGKNIEGIKTRKLAKKIKKLMELTLPDSDRSKQWALLNVTRRRDKPGNTVGPRVPVKFKSAKFVAIEDREDPDLDPDDFTQGDLITD